MLRSNGLDASQTDKNRHTIRTDPLSDVAVIGRVLEGDIDAFEVLLDRYQGHVLRIAYRHVPAEDAEETAHEVFIRAFNSLKTYRGKGGFQQWLSAVTVRTCHDYWRRHYRRRERTVSSLSTAHQQWMERVLVEQAGASYEDETSKREAEQVLAWALDQLGAKDRAVIELIYLQDHSVKEAAALLGWKVTTVKVRAFRSRRKLQRILENGRAGDPLLFGAV